MSRFTDEMKPQVITEAQRRRLFALGNKIGWSEDSIKALIAHWGYEGTQPIKRQHYDLICTCVQEDRGPTEEELAKGGGGMTVATEKISRVKAHTKYYTQDGKRVPGVTTVLRVVNKPALVPWANKLGLQGIDTRKYVDRLASVGTLAHYWIEGLLLTGKDPDLSEWSQEQQDLDSNSVLKFLKWRGQHDLWVIETEKPLASETYRYGGTLDILADVDGRRGLIDIKTSKAIYDDHMYQGWRLITGWRRSTATSPNG